MLDNAISTMEANLVKVQAAVRDLSRGKDVPGARKMFVQMTNLVKQIDRFKQLHHICACMLERVKEQAVMATTSVVMQQFVSVHEDLIKDCNLDKLVSQYQELQDNVDGIRSGFDDMANASSIVDPNEPDWDDELKNWLGEEEVVVQPQQVTAPRVEVISAGPSVAQVTGSFPQVPRSAAQNALPVTPSSPPRDRSPPPFPNPTPFPDAVAAAVVAAQARAGAMESTLSASTEPSLPVRDLKALFGKSVVHKEKTPVTEQD